MLLNFRSLTEQDDADANSEDKCFKNKLNQSDTFKHNNSCEYQWKVFPDWSEIFLCLTRKINRLKTIVELFYQNKDEEDWSITTNTLLQNLLYKSLYFFYCFYLFLDIHLLFVLFIYYFHLNFHLKNLLF